MDAATFRLDFPEFGDVAKYSNSQVAFYLTLAGKLLNVERWADLLDMGTELFIAHNLVLERQSQAAAATGAPPGVTTGAVSGKTVDKVSVTYDATAGLELNGGHWNLTVYGLRFLNLARMVGSGGLQL